MTLADNLSYNATQEIQKHELYDPRMLYYLLSINTHAAEDIRKIKRFARGATNGKKKITYTTYKGFGSRAIGRYVAKNESGLQSLPKNIRAALCKNYYWDFDIVNCHPTFLFQLCKQWGFECQYLQDYVEHRDQHLQKIADELHLSSKDTAKEVFRNIMFGSGQYDGKSEFLDKLIQEMKQITKNFCEKHKEFYEWTKKKKELQNDNRPAENSALAVFLQDVEKMIVLTIEDYMKIKKRRVDTNMFDGGHLLKLPNETEGPQDLLRGAEEWVLSKTGYSIKLLYKPMETTFVYPIDKNHIYEPDENINDAFAAKKLSELAGTNLCKNQKGDIFVFSTTKGIWSGEKNDLAELIDGFHDDLIFLQDTGKFIKKHDYGGNTTNIQKMITRLPAKVEVKEFDYDTSRGKLLFSNGIYDFDTQTFTEGFDPEIHFAGRIDRPFPATRNPDYEARVHKILFEDPYLQEQQEQAMFFKTAIARALYGDYSAKRAYLSVGEPNCGRGLLTLSLLQAFQSFVSTFSSNNLLYNAKSSDDEAKKLAWYVPISNTRIAISNEISMMGKSIDGNIMKALSSGGDVINARKLHENETPLKSRTTIFLLTNDVPEMKPNDIGIQNRLCTNELKKSYVANPDPSDPHQAQEDKRLMDEAKSKEWSDALFWILADAWAAFALTDRTAPKPAAVLAANADWIEKGVSLKSIVAEKYEFTKSEDDWILATELRSYLKSRGIKDSDTKVGREVRKMTGISKTQKKHDGKVLTVYFGLKELEDT
jgi:hypothetical protein